MNYTPADIEPLSFSERMQDAKDAMLYRRPNRPVATSYRVKRRLVEWVNVEYVAGLWGVSATRVKALCARGRIPGAKRTGRGKGSPWSIPARWDGTRNVVTVTPKAKGPKPRFQTSESGSVPF